MRAIEHDRYGPPEVLRLVDLPVPQPAANEVLVRVSASSVTTADWRLRAAEFLGLLAVPGRAMFGLFRPRNKVLGGVFGGEVKAVGPAVTFFSPGDRVFGVSGRGAHAEYLTIAENRAIVRTPDAVADTEAAAVPFGALSALVFLCDFAKLRAGQSVLIVGASGGVGSYSVQIAKIMGAHVTGVARAANHQLLCRLGADHVIDYQKEDFTQAQESYDLALDIVGATSFQGVRATLKPDGLFIPLNFGLREIWQSMWMGSRCDKRLRIGISGDNRPDLEKIAAWLNDGRLHAVVDGIYPMDAAVEAHRAVETRHRNGTILLDMSAPEPSLELRAS